MREKKRVKCGRKNAGVQCGNVGIMREDKMREPRSFVVLYADDILLTAPSVSELQELFDACAIELSWLDCRHEHK